MSSSLPPDLSPAPAPVTAVGFDADDTLWHNEDAFHEAEAAFIELVAPWADADHARSLLLDHERANLELFGYGVKPFVLSMIETAIDVSGGAIDTSAIKQMIGRGKHILGRPPELLDDAGSVIPALATRYPLLLITKGDLAHQERKIAASGLAEHFTGVHVVSEKDAATYTRILARHGIDPHGFVMVGNSVRSDVLPVLAIGGRGVHIPYHVTWALELATVGENQVPVIEGLRHLPAVLEKWSSAAAVRRAAMA